MATLFGMAIPFSLPLIDDDVIAEVNDALTNTGWLTSGPKVRQLEAEIGRITGTPVLCVNSWTSGAMLMLRWFGVGAGDEVIVPAYTYAATALCAMNLGATAVLVDVRDDFTIDPELMRAAITEADEGDHPGRHRRASSRLRGDLRRARRPGGPRFIPSRE